MLYGDSQNILWNLKLLFDVMFLKDGHFKNVQRNDTVRSIDISKLVRDPSSDHYFMGVSGAQVWQSPFQEWVYESGITLNNAPFISGLAEPIRASGIWVNGTFFAQSAGVSGNLFNIDYINGRVIFTGAGLPSNLIVQAEYAYKFYRIDFVDRFSREDIRYHSETELKDNPFSNGNASYPSGGFAIGTIPAIFLECDEDDAEPYELGNRSQIIDQPIICHVYAYSSLERDVAMDLIRTRRDIHMPMVDFNYAPFPLSGLVSTISPVYIPYQTLLENVQYQGNNVISKHFTIESIKGKPQESLGKLERGVVRIETKIWNIAPMGRIGQNPYI